MSVDLKRSAKARLVESIFDAQPGDCVVTVDDRGATTGLLFICPGCGRHGSLPLVGSHAWTVVEGAVSHPESLTLSPSILHDNPARGGRCGWHGYLINGVFTPC